MNTKARNVIYSFPIILILIFTLLLLVYIGYGEASRKYAQFQIGKLASQAEVIKNDFEAFLQAGLPLYQFSGFAGSSENLILSDASIENIQVRDTRNQLVFIQTQPDITVAALQATIQKRDYQPTSWALTANGRKDYQVEQSAASFRVIVPLTGKFGPAGDIVIEAKQADIFNVLHEQYQNVYYAFILISLGFILFIVLYEILFAEQKYRKTVQRSAFIFSFLLMSLVVGITVFHTYERGAEASAKALADSMAQRLKAVLDLGVEFDDIAGINEVFDEYKRNNPEISEIAFTDRNVVHYHTDENLIGQLYEVSPENYYYVVPLNETRHLLVTLTIPKDLVLKAVLDSLKEFIVLFIASGLIALIFLDSGTQLVNLSQLTSARRPTQQVNDQSYLIGLSLIKPAYFILVFVNGLPISFLPQLVTEMAENTMTLTQIASASLPFTIYYLMFAIVLVPAGYYAEKGVSLKKIMAVGFAAEFIGAILIVTTSEYWVLVAGRFFSGIGQGIFLIGLQSYILHITPKEQRTRGAAVKVVSKNAGQIAGTAIGALLFAYIGYQLLFLIASILTLIGILYLWTLVPRPEVIVGILPTPAATAAKPKAGLFQGIVKAIKDAEFSKTLVLIGLFGKMNITGVAMFAVPLVLATNGVPTSDIGQALMVYYLSLIIMTHYASKIVDVWISTRAVLFLSAVIGGISMLLFGLTTAIPTPNVVLLPTDYLMIIATQFQQWLNSVDISGFSSYFMLFCLFLLGVSNGLSLAPLTTHIAKTEVAERYGNKSVTATYTFLERSGHVLGPVVISQLLLLTHKMALAVSVFGIIVLFLGLIFVLTSQKS